MMPFIHRLLRLRRLPRDLFSSLNDIRAEMAATRRSVADLSEMLIDLTSAIQQIDRTGRARAADLDGRFEQVARFLIQERADRTDTRRKLDLLHGSFADMDAKITRHDSNADRYPDSAKTADHGRVGDLKD